MSIKQGQCSYPASQDFRNTVHLSFLLNFSPTQIPGLDRGRLVTALTQAGFCLCTFLKLRSLPLLICSCAAVTNNPP